MTLANMNQRQRLDALALAQLDGCKERNVDPLEGWTILDIVKWIEIGEPTCGCGCGRPCMEQVP